MRRKAKTFYASRGVIAAYGDTKADAKAKLEAQIDWALGGSELHIEHRFNSMIVITRDPGGWQYKLVDLSTSKHGMSYGSSCQQNGEFKDVLMSARMHAAQNAWSQDVAADNLHVTVADLDERRASELASWIAWQRRYAAAIAAGKDKNEAWNIASENPRLVA